jgi:hypothetical protein
MMTTTRTQQSTASVPPTTLLLALELGERMWKLGFTTGHGPAPSDPTDCCGRR